MNQRKEIFLCSLFFLISLFCDAQPKPKHGKKLEETHSFRGKITNWVHNNDYLYDGFNLKSVDNQDILVKFPPWMANDILEMGTQNINIEGIFKKHKNELILTKISNGKHKVLTRNRMKYREKIEHKRVKGKGILQDIRLNKKGDPDAYILDNNTLLKIPTHVFKQLKNIIPLHTMLEYEGIKKTIQNGEVQAKNVDIIHAQSITVNGTKYYIK